MKKIFFTLLISIAILIGLQVYFTSRRAMEGDLISKLQSRLDQVNAENSLLSVRIISLTSMDKIEAFAKSNHMVPKTLSALGSAAVAVRVE
jgi:cell division protein FtsL